MKKYSVCIGDTVNKHATGRRRNYLYINSPGGAFSIILFGRALILWSRVRLLQKSLSTANWDRSACRLR